MAITRAAETKGTGTTISINPANPANDLERHYLSSLLRFNTPGTFLRKDVQISLPMRNRRASGGFVKFSLTNDVIITEQTSSLTTAYVINERLGAVAFGTVYKSNHVISGTRHNHVVITPQPNVVKVHNLTGDTPAEKERHYQAICNEARQLSQFFLIRNMVRCNDQILIVSAYQEGRTLDQCNFSQFSLEKRIALALDLCALVVNLQAMQASRQCILQGNLKPSHILYNVENGTIYINDVGMTVEGNELKIPEDKFSGTNRSADTTGIPTPAADIDSLAPILAKILGCNHNSIFRPTYPRNYNFSELHTCIPDWMDPTSIITFLERMNHPTTNRPDITSVQHFFVELNRRILARYTEVSDELAKLEKQPSSYELNHEIQQALHYKEAAQQKTKDLHLKTALPVVGVKKTDQEEKTHALTTIPSITSLVDLHSRAKKEIEIYKQYQAKAKTLIPYYEKAFPKKELQPRFTVAPGDLISKIQKHEIHTGATQIKLDDIEQKIEKRKTFLLSHALQKSLDTLATELNVFDSPMSKNAKKLGNDFTCSPHSSIAKLNAHVSANIDILTKSITDLNIKNIEAKTVIKSVYEDIKALTDDKLDIDVKAITNVTLKINKTSNLYHELKEELALLADKLTGPKFAGTNSSGIKAMIGHIRDPQKSLLQQLSAIIGVAVEKTTGDQWWSRHHFFGKGRHENVETLYKNIAQLKIQPNLQGMIAAIKTINQSFNDNDFVHVSCWNFCRS